MARPEETPIRLVRYDAGEAAAAEDFLATEEPLEIRLVSQGQKRSVAVTLRTPGADFELAAGFLFAEGVVSAPGEIVRLGHSEDEIEACHNVVEVELAAGLAPDLAPLERHFFTSSACGVCGKASLENLRLRTLFPLADGPVVTPATVTALPERLREAQGVFAKTGGLHAAALFTAEGELVAVREDIGRHNALDKLVGWAFLAGRLPLSSQVLLVSGRTSYEILQKSRAAGLGLVCGVSAPSSLAVDLAQGFGMTLVGFLRGSRFNVYSGAERIAGLPAASRDGSGIRLTVLQG
jgi:FdhD protein